MNRFNLSLPNHHDFKRVFCYMRYSSSYYKLQCFKIFTCYTIPHITKYHVSKYACVTCDFLSILQNVV